MDSIFPLAEISYAVCINFNPNFSQQLIDLNKALTKEYGPGTYALNDWWQPHLTLFQGGTNQEGISRLLPLLEEELRGVSGGEIVFDELECTKGGLLLLNAKKTESLMDIESRVSAACAIVHAENPLYRPRAIAKWPRLEQRARMLVLQTGNYKTRDLFSPHISIAEIASAPMDKMLEIATSILSLPIHAEIASVSFIDSGHQNEKGQSIRNWR